jgi:hypothetical protein
VARTDTAKAPPTPKQLAWRETFGRRYGGRMRELVKRDRELTDARTDSS